MINVISAREFDLSGWVELHVKAPAETGEVRRRVNRVATLDGGSVVNDGGFADADRTLDLTWQPTSSATEAAVEYLVRTYAQVNVSTRAGFFRAIPATYTPGSDESTMRMLVLEKLSA
jgi:hypothetical protein